jgi:gamma-glutamyltranspeptidase/glutathione hydrolase
MSTQRLIRLAIASAGAVLGACSAAPHAGHFQQEAVAADHAVASRAGAEMLRRGGNAVDAAVAASFALSVVRPYSCGIGGGGFMVVHITADGAAAARRNGHDLVGGDYTLNYRETAPAAVGAGSYESLDAVASTHGGKAVGVPGTVAGLLLALERFGTLPREQVLAPAIRAAEEGFTADEHFASESRALIRKFREHRDWAERFPLVWNRYLLEGRVKGGDRIRIPEQAAALRLIARDGAVAFYHGPIAAAIVESVARDGGVITREDLAQYAPAAPEPLRFRFKGFEFIGMPPPSSGGVAMAETLHILGRTMPEPPRPLRIGSNVAQIQRAVAAANRDSQAMQAFLDGPLYLHALAEAFKHAFADRSRWLGDPAFVPVPVERLSSEPYAAELAARFHPGRTLSPDHYGSLEPGVGAPAGPRSGAAPDDHGTSHLCAIDRWGSAVACTETINLTFGSCLAVEPYGFVLNDQMDDFTTRRGQANTFGLAQSDRNLPDPGKRPLSSMSPTIVLERGHVRAVAGAAGGPRIITATTQVLLNALLFGDPASDAVARPRVHHQWSPDVLRLEPALYNSARGPWTPGGPATLPEALARFGHTVEAESPGAVAQLILRNDDGSCDAACDPRKGGVPAGR